MIKPGDERRFCRTQIRFYLLIAIEVCFRVLLTMLYAKCRHVLKENKTLCITGTVPCRYKKMQSPLKRSGDGSNGCSQVKYRRSYPDVGAHGRTVKRIVPRLCFVGHFKEPYSHWQERPAADKISSAASTSTSKLIYMLQGSNPCPL